MNFMKLIRYLYRVLLALLFFLMVVFSIRNNEPVTLKLIAIDPVQVPLIVLMLCSVLIGAVLGMLAGLSRGLRQHREVLRLRSELSRLRGTTEKSISVVPPTTGISNGV